MSGHRTAALVACAAAVRPASALDAARAMPRAKANMALSAALSVRRIGHRLELYDPSDVRGDALLTLTSP